MIGPLFSVLKEVAILDDDGMLESIELIDGSKLLLLSPNLNGSYSSLITKDCVTGYSFYKI